MQTLNMTITEKEDTPPPADPKILSPESYPSNPKLFTDFETLNYLLVLKP